MTARQGKATGGAIPPAVGPASGSSPRASAAVFLSKSRALADILHMPNSAVLAVALRLVIEYGGRTGMSNDGLVQALTDAMAARQVEGAGHE